MGVRGWLGDAVAIIDATRPLKGDFPRRNEVPQDAMERVGVSEYLADSRVHDKEKC
jgi:hypothetical protein